MASATFKVNGSVPSGAVSVAYGSTVNLALVSTVGATSIAWDVVARSHTDSSLPTITPAGSPLGATASFTFRSAPGDSAGRAYTIRCTVTDGNGNSASNVVVIGVYGTAGVIPFVPGETTERSAELGWTGDVNAAIEGMGSGNVGLAGYIDVSKAPYGAIPDDRTKAAANTVAIQAAITAAQTSGSVVWFPPGLWWVAKGAGGEDATGYTCALSLGDDPVTLAGCGAMSSVLCYCSSGGNYSAIVHHPETANVNTESYRREVHIRDLGFDCDDDGGSPGDQALFAIKSRKLVNSSIIGCRVTASSSAGIALDFCFDTTISRCDVSYNTQHGIVVGAYAFNFNGNQIHDCTFAYNTGVGIVAAGGVSNQITGCIFQNNGMGGILAWRVASLEIAGCYFEANCEGGGPSGTIVYPDSGLHFTGGLAAYTDIFCFRGSVDGTDPEVWTYTLDPTNGGDFWDSGSNNPGIVVRDCYTAQYTANEVFVGSNAADGIVIDGCKNVAGTSNSIYKQFANGTHGYGMRFTVRDCSGFTDPGFYYWTWGGQLRDIGQSRVDGVSRRNLLGPDVILECMQRMPNAASNYLTGELTLSTSVSFKGRPAYKLSGESSFAAKGIAFNTVVQPELANKWVVIGAWFYVPSLSGVWPTACPMLASYDGVTGTDPHLTSRPFTTGWTYRSLVYQLPAAGVAYLGFSQSSVAGAAYMSEPAIHELGAPHEEVIANADTPTGWRCALNLQLDKAGNEAKSFGANGATTVAGISCTVANYANSSPAMSVQADGSGLLITPVAATNLVGGDITAPRVEFKLADLIPGYHPGMKIRVWVANPTNNAAANWDAALVGVWDGGDFTGTSGGFVWVRGWANAAEGHRTLWYGAGSLLHYSSTNAALAASNNASLILGDDIGHQTPQVLNGQMGTSWPTSLTVGGGSNTPTANVGLTSANARVCLSAQRASSGTSFATKFTHLRIDYQP